MDKKTLRQYRALVMEIDELEAEKKRILDRYLSPPKLSGMPHGSGEADRIGDVVARRERYQRLIDAKLDSLLELRVRIEAAIGKLPADERRLIRLYYVDGKRWEQVAVDLSYSIQHVWRLHGRILQKLNDERQ